MGDADESVPVVLDESLEERHDHEEADGIIDEASQRSSALDSVISVATTVEDDVEEPEDKRWLAELGNKNNSLYIWGDLDKIIGVQTGRPPPHCWKPRPYAQNSLTPNNHHIGIAQVGTGSQHGAILNGSGRDHRRWFQDK